MVQSAENQGIKRATSAVINPEQVAKFSQKEEHDNIEKIFKTTAVDKSQIAATPIAEESSQNRNTPIKSNNDRPLASSQELNRT